MIGVLSLALPFSPVVSLVSLEACGESGGFVDTNEGDSAAESSGWIEGDM
jgi:hypothetical protein